MKSRMRRFLALAMGVLVLFAGAPEAFAGSDVVEFTEGGSFRTVRFVQYDALGENRSVLQELEVPEGMTPEYSGPVPSCAVPEEYADIFERYDFVGWEPEIGPVTIDTEYVAQFEGVEKLYTVQYIDGNGVALQSQELSAESWIFLYDGETPTKASTPEFDYVFSGWDPVPDEEMLTEHGRTFYAQFNEQKRTYPITWKNDDGSVIETTNVAYGTVPIHADAVKADTDEFTYIFVRWDPEPTAVTGPAEYKATFDGEKRSYEITWKNDDGSVIETVDVAYGEVPAHNGASKADTDEFTYPFAGWTPEITAVTGPAEYKATFNAAKRKYKITWKDAHETLAATYEEYGKVPTPPVLAFDINPKYTVIGYSPELKAVTGDATYTVLFQENEQAGGSPASYTITWKNDDGSVIDTTTMAYGKMPVHADATKADDNQYSYTFTGWTPEIAAVTGDATYTATYEKKDLSVTYGLEVIHGSGSGYYKPGTIVRITADARNDVMEFKTWDGDTDSILQGGGGLYLAETILKMPAQNVTVSAIYGSSTGEKAVNKSIQQAANAVTPAQQQQQQTAAAPKPQPKAALSPQRITVNGVEAMVEAYNIDGEDYFKLSDLAALLKGTPAQFNVSYDEATNTIFLTKGAVYDGDVGTNFTDNSASAVPSPQTVELDGARVDLTAYNIGGSCFFSLRELADYLGYALNYDEATNTVIIESM